MSMNGKFIKRHYRWWFIGKKCGKPSMGLFTVYFKTLRFLSVHVFFWELLCCIGRLILSQHADFWYFWIMHAAASENLMRNCFSIVRLDRLWSGCLSLCAQNDRSSVPARITVLLCKLQPVLSDVTAVVLCPFNGKVV